MTSHKGILIVGAKPQGLQAALTLASCGRKVSLVEKGLELERRIGSWGEKGDRWGHYLSTQVTYHPLIDVLTETEIVDIRESFEGVEVDLVQRPQWILPTYCVNCQRCFDSCPVQLPNGIKPIFELRAPASMAIDKREKPPCRLACPLDMNPQGYVALIAEGRFDEAYELILDKNPLPGICGRVCHHPCEQECRRQEVDESIAICALKRFAADEARKRRRKGIRERISRPHGPRVAIIGSGPSGLTAAHDLAKAGLRPTLIEADSKPGGLLCQGIAPYRLPREIIEEEIEQILALGVELRLNSPVCSWQDIQRLQAEGFRAILLATGASKDLRMNIKGEELENVYGCVSFLKGLWNGIRSGSLGRVAVIGGGNAAIEAARASIRAGAQSVSILYRRTRNEMPADPHEVTLALEEGVELADLTVPVQFAGSGNRLTQIKCIKMKLKGVDASGRPRPIPIDGSDFFLTADTAIVSIGQEAQFPYESRGTSAIDPLASLEITGEGGTSIPGIYASGDAVSGPSTVVEAMASGRRAAQAIIHHLRHAENGSLQKTPELSRGAYEPIPKGIRKHARSPSPHRKVSKRVSDFDEVIGTFPPEDAIREASRCLQCGVCSECLRCETSCDLGAIRHDRVTTQQSFCFDQVMVSDAEQFAPKFESSRVIRIGGYGRRESWGKALVAGRAAAMEMLSKTQPGKVQPIPRKRRGTGDSKVGIFICSCNGTLNEDGRMTDMIGALEKIQNVAHVEIVVSACHPEKGRRIEEVISKKGLNGALIASCVCCHLDFACESCNDQRIRLKNRLFRVMGYEPKHIALVNIKETCLLPYTENGKRGAEMAIKVIRSGLWQLREHKSWSLEDNRLHRKALVLGATEAGIAAAKGLKAQFRSVGLMEGQQVEKRVHRELRDWGIELMCPVRPVCLNGHHGRFTLIVEKGGPSKSGALKKKEKELVCRTVGGRQYLDSQAIGEDPRYQTLEADIIILGRKEFKDIPYIRDAFSQHDYAGGKKAFGSLETRIPGVYLASWSQAQNIPDEALGKSAASQAIEGTSQAAEPSEFLVAHVDPELCRGCGKCADICPEGAVHLEEITRGTASARIEPWLCTGCGNCIGECPTGAIRLPESEQAYFEKVINAFLG